MTLKIWCNSKFPDNALKLLTENLGRHQLLFAGQLSQSVLTPGGHDPLLAEADIAFGQPDPQQVARSPKLMWVHLTSAGYTRYDTDAFREAMRSRGAIVTNSSSVYDEPCAEHALAMILALARRLPQTLDAQRTDHGWVDLPIREQSRLLIGQSILIYGFGAIARRLVEMLKPLGLKITGVRRHPTGDEGVPIVTAEQADELLPTTDHVMNILPGAPHTDHFFDAARLGRLNCSACFYNIGRGATVDQDVLQSMLNDRKIAAAYLDVMTPEPLPPGHPLWSTPNCWITPHTAGGHDTEFIRLVEHFLDNLRRFVARTPVRDRVM